MKISQMFSSGKPVLSFEVFPPKPGLPIDTVYSSLEKLKVLNPAFISVTYGAGGSTSERSIEIVDKVKNQYGVDTVAHLTCVGATCGNIDSILDKLQNLGIENILALRGDPPAGNASFVPAANGFSYAKDLISHIKGRDFFNIAAAAYPEGHPECSDRDKDISYLKQKVDQGVDLLVTQLFFDNSFFYSFRDNLRRKGINCPITIGIMPVLNVGQIQRMTELCGATIPADLAAIMDKFGAIPADMEKAGIDFATRQIEDLIANGVDGIHICTMNKAAQTKTIVTNLGSVFK